MTGLTAYFGLLDIGKPKPGDTVVVSAAAGAVGSVAGQIAKLKGAASSASPAAPRSAAWSRRVRLRRRGRLQGRRLARTADEATPKGIDVDFENVGGEIMEAVFARMNLYGRMPLAA